MSQLHENVIAIRKRIAQCALSCSRDPDSIRLVAVTKTYSTEKILPLYECGIGEIGENRVQELKSKYPDLGERFKIHMVGHLQSNKVKDAVPMVCMVQSVDSLKIAKLLDQECERQNKLLDILLQVNTSGEETKQGMNLSEVCELAGQIISLKHLAMKGLMTIGKLHGDEVETRFCFRRLSDVRNRLRIQGIPSENLAELSMGMTGDFEIAIQEGATMLRIGSAIMGQRIETDFS